MRAPKPLLDWGGRTLIEHHLSQLHDAGTGDIVVVLGHAADRIRPVVERLDVRIVVNENYAAGRASSLRLGATAVSESSATVVVASVDQPRPASIMRRLIEEHRRSNAKITVPAHAGKRGHPVVLDASLLPELREVREETQGLREVLRRHYGDVREVAFDSPLVLLDINTPNEYETAKALYFAQDE
ncbi:MAG: nucleotidyltransferase family protein [Chloroflexi bacterium]|nr:MAG: nucleotidyltransferase family protein [Chloroflexota bacterium]